MNQIFSTDFVVIPITGKQNKIRYEGYVLNYDRTTNQGKKFWRCKRRDCKVSFSLFLDYNQIKFLHT